MKMVDLARTPAQLKEEREIESPVYSWGLELRLEEEELQKLGLKELPAVGESLRLVAVARVMRASSEERAKGTERELVLKVHQLALAPGGEQRLESMLYDSGGEGK